MYSSGKCFAFGCNVFSSTSSSSFQSKKLCRKLRGVYRGSACFCRSNHFSALHFPNLLPSIKAPCTEQVPRAEREKLGGFFILFNPHYSQPMGNPVKRSVRIFSVEGNVTSQLEGSLGRLGWRGQTCCKKTLNERWGRHPLLSLLAQFILFLVLFKEEKGKKSPH